MAAFLLNVLKFTCAVFLIPIVIASTFAFHRHMEVYPDTNMSFFFYGILTFILIYLFIYQCWGLYESGQKVTSQIFKFIAPFDQVLGKLFPIYAIFILLAFYVTANFFHNHAYNHYFLFFGGFIYSMHLVLTAQELQQAENSPIKPTYLFLICFIFIFNIFTVVLFFDLIHSKWTFPTYLSSVWKYATDIFVPSFNKINSVIETIHK